MKFEVIAASLFSAYLVYKVIEHQKNIVPIETTNYGSWILYIGIILIFILSDIETSYITSNANADDR